MRCIQIYRRLDLSKMISNLCSFVLEKQSRRVQATTNQLFSAFLVRSAARHKSGLRLHCAAFCILRARPSDLNWREGIYILHSLFVVHTFSVTRTLPLYKACKHGNFLLRKQQPRRKEQQQK